MCRVYLVRREWQWKSWNQVAHNTIGNLFGRRKSSKPLPLEPECSTFRSIGFDFRWLEVNRQGWDCPYVANLALKYHYLVVASLSRLKLHIARCFLAQSKTSCCTWKLIMPGPPLLVALSSGWKRAQPHKEQTKHNLRWHNLPSPVRLMGLFNANSLSVCFHSGDQSGFYSKFFRWWSSATQLSNS